MDLDRKDGVYVLPAATKFVTYGSVTASNCSVSNGGKITEPVYAVTDHTIIYKFFKEAGFDKEMFKNIKVTEDEPLIEDVTREFKKGMRNDLRHSRLNAFARMANQSNFDDPAAEVVCCRGLRIALAVLGY